MRTATCKAPCGMQLGQYARLLPPLPEHLVTSGLSAPQSQRLLALSFAVTGSLPIFFKPKILKKKGKSLAKLAHQISPLATVTGFETKIVKFRSCYGNGLQRPSGEAASDWECLVHPASTPRARLLNMCFDIVSTACYSIASEPPIL